MQCIQTVYNEKSQPHVGISKKATFLIHTNTKKHTIKPQKWKRNHRLKKKKNFQLFSKTMETDTHVAIT